MRMRQPLGQRLVLWLLIGTPTGRLVLLAALTAVSAALIRGVWRMPDAPMLWLCAAVFGGLTVYAVRLVLMSRNVTVSDPTESADDTFEARADRTMFRAIDETTMGQGLLTAVVMVAGLMSGVFALQTGDLILWGLTVALGLISAHALYSGLKAPDPALREDS